MLYSNQIPVFCANYVGSRCLHARDRHSEPRIKITRFIPTADRDSQFVDVNTAFDNGTPDAFGHLVRRSGALPAQSTMLTEMPEGMNQDWRPASRQQFVIGLSGTVEVETSDGQKRRWSSGEFFLADDSGSRGDRTQRIGGLARVLFVHLPPEASIAG